VNGQWLLQRRNAVNSTVLGDTLTAIPLDYFEASPARLWVNLPASQSLAAGLSLHDPNSAVQGTMTLANANYLLVGSLTEDGMSYAWLHKDAFVAGAPAAGTRRHSAGCSANSPYPSRSDWVASTANARASALNTDAARLAKVHGWLELADNPSGASPGNYYHLEVIRDGTSIKPGDPEREGDSVSLALVSDGGLDDRVIEKRWVYVLDVDCHGRGSLLFPDGNTENRFPNDSDTSSKIVLEKDLVVGEPYGTDTIFLISTGDPLPDPYALNFEGVVARGLPTRGQLSNPLQNLLSETSDGSRGFPARQPAMSTRWGLQMLTVTSVPKEKTP
jgi:hypothetical protein